MILTDFTRTNLYVSRSDRVSSKSSSAGNQIKWHKNDLWVKANLLGYEDVAEVAVSHFLSFTDLSPGGFVQYYGCHIVEDGISIGDGCYSYDFLPVGAEELSVAEILEDNLESFAIDYDELRMLLYDYLKCDPKGYLDKILCVDAIIRNCDRHFGNFSLICKDGVYTPAPLFDHGDSCLSDVFTYPMTMDFMEAFNATCIAAKPFKCEYLRNLVDNRPLRVRYNDYVHSIDVQHPNMIRAVRTILQGLTVTEGKAWVRL